MRGYDCVYPHARFCTDYEKNIIVFKYESTASDKISFMLQAKYCVRIIKQIYY